MNYNTNLNNISTILNSIENIEFFYFENEYINADKNKIQFIFELIIYSNDLNTNILKNISNIFERLPKTTIKLINNQKPLRFKIKITK